MPAILSAQSHVTPPTRRVVETRSIFTARIEVSLDDRTQWVIAGNDTLRSAPIAVAMASDLQFGNRRWTFQTPRGHHVVLDKRADPVGRPPDWHYAVAALEHGLQMQSLSVAGVTLRDGRRLIVRASPVGVMPVNGGEFLPLPEDEHIVFDSVLYIPPFGSRNREIVGELGRFALDIGDGYLLHGTPDESSVGNAVTHGWLRLLDEDIARLFDNVPLGAAVIIR